MYSHLDQILRQLRKDRGRPADFKPGDHEEHAADAEADVAHPVAEGLSAPPSAEQGLSPPHSLVMAIIVAALLSFGLLIGLFLGYQRSAQVDNQTQGSSPSNVSHQENVR